MTKPVADILLLLEGTYPYIRGGVSSWVHQLIQGLPELTFELMFLGGSKAAYGPMQYQLPKNVTALHTHYLMDIKAPHTPNRRSGNKNAFNHWLALQYYFRQTDRPIPEENIKELFSSLGVLNGFEMTDFLYSEASWDVICQYFERYCDDPSFINFFWTYRSMFAPLFKIAELARQAPKTRVVHSISTGYAGFLGAGIHALHQTPFLLTEHGIYTKERTIDLIQAEWIQESEAKLYANLNATMGDMRQMWIKFFEQLGRSAYQQAQRITSLYPGNQQRQIRDGAPSERTDVIANGIALERFSQIAQQDRPSISNVVGLIGRVVPIKDIKTFIRSIKEAIAYNSSIEGWIVGPLDEDEAYVAECRLLVKSLDLESHIKFLGMQNVVEIFPQLGLTALTSISEAQPLVLLESMASGVPVLATQVGSCNELINGYTEQDKALGPSGELVPIASAVTTGQTIAKMLADPERWQCYRQSGLKRVNQFYGEQLMFSLYRQQYKDLM
ncbi:GT4 family glycosyltransferase PelF [Celerinatantimonas sp. MCCC 1A17872]|uniref:GT4 family glycosyltransferase PelF n=1 Tax=Celerinatantimonas sp. MCCC 1A17872 TaxID=3177514 RepID=UPI0038C56266